MSGINNPFAPTPASVVQQTANRFPDISNDPSLQQQQGQQGYGQQQPQQGYYPQQPQQSQGYMQSQSTGYVQPQMTGYPTSSFNSTASSSSNYLTTPQAGYQHATSPSPYGYQQQQQQAQQYQPASSPQPPPFTMQDLDPYSQLGSLHQQQNSQQQQNQHQQQQQGGGGGRQLTSSLGQVQQTQSHPRQFVQENKAILMTWDDYAWKQLLARLDALREGWESRKSSIQQVAMQGADPVSIERLRKEAENYIDSIHASKFQLAEVKDTWRHSTDMASKNRVREALNAGLTSLPEYPPPLQPDQLGGQFAKNAYDDYRKQSILSGYQQPQMTGYTQQQQQQPQYGGGMMAAQPTGYYQQGAGGYMQSQPTGYYGYAPATGGQQGYF